MQTRREGATIRQVAEACGLSPATVSNVLNAKRELTRPETRDRVLEAVRRLQYSPPTAARPLLLRNVGVIICAEDPKASILGNPYFNLMLDGVFSSAHEIGWSATIFLESMWSDAERTIRERCDGHCDGLIVVAPATESSIVEALRSRGATFVVAGGGNGLPGISSVDVDNHDGAAHATRHLIELGHRRIAHISGGGSQLSAVQRQAGYEAAMVAEGLAPLVAPGDYTAEGGERGALRLLGTQAEARPTAIVCANDAQAAGVRKVAGALGMSVPGDLSLTGFDDYPDSPAAEDLTSLRQPLGEIGARAFRVIVDALLAHRSPRETIAFPAELVRRGTTAPPNGFLPRTRRVRSNGGNLTP